MDNSTKVNMKVDPEHYFNEEYDVKGRFVTYWHQINEVKTLNPKDILDQLAHCKNNLIPREEWKQEFLRRRL